MSSKKPISLGEKVVIDGTKDVNELKTSDWRHLTGVQNPNNFPIYFTTLKVSKLLFIRHIETRLRAET